MSSKNKKLVAILGGRIYQNNLTLKNFLIPSIRKELEENGIDFIVATNNFEAAIQYKQIKNLKTVVIDEELHQKFINRRRESKNNLGAETRELINQYAIKNKYQLVCHLDDNITSIFYHFNYKTITIKKYKPRIFLEIIKLLFYIAENSNAGCVGIMMSYFPAKSEEIKITAGFPYSFFVHKVDPKFEFENSTEDDILMSIYNGENHKPSCVIRNAFYYGKTGKTTSKDGNRMIYNEMLKENKRGEYISSKYPEIYSRKVSYMVKSCSYQKNPFLQHKHKLKIPAQWNKDLKIESNCIEKIKNLLLKIREMEN